MDGENVKLRSFTDNVWTVFLSRMSMVAAAPIVGAMVWLGSSWLDQKFEALREPLEKLNGRVTVLETGTRSNDIIDTKQDMRIDGNTNAITTVTLALSQAVQQMNDINKNLAVLADREKRPIQ